MTATTAVLANALPRLSLAVWLLVSVTAVWSRGAAFGAYTAMAVGLYTYAALALAPLAVGTAAGALFAMLHALVYLHLFLFLAQPRMRGTAYRALVSLPGAWFLGGTMLALPWAVAAQLGARSALFVASVSLPYLVALVGLLQSLTARRDELHIPLDGSDAGALARYQPGSARQARPLRVAQISDPHLGPFMSVARLQRICAEAVAADPDLILLTGDFLTMDSQESGEYLTQALAPLRPLAGRTFACRGNHDLEAPAVVAGALAACGVRLLIDEATTAQTPYGEVELIGFDFVFQ